MTANEMKAQTELPHPLLHRIAVLIVCLVWPLIWVGGLVTTYDAGMSVPDWPGTYGYNLFLYPYKTWLLGPFDLFIEHGHRLLGSLVGLVAIGLVIVAIVKEPRRWVKTLSVVLLVMVIFQGVLGGVRVVLADRTLAMVHGCFAPIFFAVCVATAVVTSRRWAELSGKSGADLSGKNRAERSDKKRSATTSQDSSADGNDVLSSVKQRALLSRFAGILGGGLVLVSYFQLVFGAMLRHFQPAAEPGSFAAMVAIHVLTAFLLWGMTGLNWLSLRKCGDLTLSRPSVILIGLVVAQIMLGVGTWAVNYGWPSVLAWVPGTEGFLVRAKGFTDAVIVTAHVATGALILAVSTMIWIRGLRSRWCLARLLSPNPDQQAVPQSAQSAPAS